MAAQGYVGAAIAICCFGTYAVPVKIVPTGDGFVFQWVQCCAILIVGLITQLAFNDGFIFEPIAMIGGALWTLGNLTVVPVINRIGLGMGVLLWGIVNMLVGWLTGTAGILIKAEVVPNPVLNYIGVAVAAASFFFYFLVKTESSAVETSEDASLDVLEADGLAPSDSTTSRRHKVVGVLLAVFAGMCYGFNMLPVTYLSNQHPEITALRFGFSHFSGIFLCSTLVLIIYCIYKRNLPQVESRSLLAGLIAGTLWAIAQSAWFISNQNLQQIVAFPMITTGPGIVANIWGILAFKEIRGRNNILKLLLAFGITLAGILLISFSNL